MLETDWCLLLHLLGDTTTGRAQLFHLYLSAHQSKRGNVSLGRGRCSPQMECYHRSAKGQGRWNVPLSVPGKGSTAETNVQQLFSLKLPTKVTQIIWLIPAQEVELTSPTSTSSWAEWRGTRRVGNTQRRVGNKACRNISAAPQDIEMPAGKHKLHIKHDAQSPDSAGMTQSQPVHLASCKPIEWKENKKPLEEMHLFSAQPITRPPGPSMWEFISCRVRTI